MIFKYIFILLCFSVIPISVAIPPINDNLADSINIVGYPYSNTVSAIDSDSATSETGETFCDSGFYNGTWWYTLTILEDGTISANALTQNAVILHNDTAVNVAIYSGTTFPLLELACDASFTSSTTNPSVDLVVIPGTYHIAVGNSTANVTLDNIDVNISFAPTTPVELLEFRIE